MGGSEDWIKPGGVATCPPRTPVTQGLGWAGAVAGRGLTFGHAVQDHVYEDVGARPPGTVAAGGDGDKAELGTQQEGGGEGTWRLGVEP